MQSFYDVVVDTGNNPIVGAQVFVYDSLGALATLFSDVNGTPQANPITTNADGGYLFYAANGIYSIVIVATGYNSQTLTGVTISSGTPPTVPIANGGTGATTASGARTNLGLAIGTDIPSLTGTGASGTWNISVLGNAATATLANNVTGTVAVANGGTGVTTLASGQFLKGAGTSAITTASAVALGSEVSGTLPVANGGTGITSFGTGVATALGANVNASNGITTPDGTATLTNKRIDPRVSSAASASSVTPDVSSYDQYAFTALAATLAINAPIGTPVDGTKLIFRFLDNGVARTLNWNGTYTAIGVTLPTVTVANKTTYVGCIYNSTATRWDVVAVATQA